MVAPTRVAGTAASSVVSFGDAVHNKSLYSVNDPQYGALADRLSKALTKVMDREAQRMAAKKPKVVVQSLTVQQQGDIEREYPEFDLKFANLQSPPHAGFVARRALASELMRAHLARYVSTSVHCGGALLNAVIEGDRDAHFEYDMHDAVSMHYAYDASLAVMQLSGAPVDMHTKFGFSVPMDNYEDFLTGKAWSRCVNPCHCDVRSEGFSADLTMQAMSVSQVVAGMMQAHSVIGIVALPYHPLMIQQDEGELPGLGVHYSVNEHSVAFKYPEGVAGVSAFPYAAWHEWLAVNHRVFSGPAGKRTYRFERKVYRGCFMFIEITEVPKDTPPPDRAVHALDLNDGEGLVKVRVWRLKYGRADVQDPDSWYQKDVVFTQSVVDKLYELGMSSPSGQFNKYALLKRASVVDSRITTEGTSVHISPAMEEEDMLDLVAAVHARCFVDRYRMGKSHDVMRKRLEQALGFHNMSFMAQCFSLVMVIRNGVWDSLMAGTIDRFRRFLDRLREKMGGIPKTMVAEFERAPKYYKLSEESSLWSKAWGAVAGASVYTAEFYPTGKGAYLVQSLQTEGTRSMPTGAMAAWYSTGSRVRDYNSTAEPGPMTDAGRRMVEAAHGVADLPTRPNGEVFREVETAVPTADAEQVRPDYNVDSEYVQTLTQIHESLFSGMGLQDYSYDAAALALDPQDRTIEAKYLKMPANPSPLPPERSVYKGRIRAYNVEKRAQTMQELLGAVNARNMSAPRLSMMQNTEVMYPEIWENFLKTMCVPDAKKKLRAMRNECGVITKDGLVDWSKKAKPAALETMVATIERMGKAFEEYDVGEYQAMLKSDAKPPLSGKPLKERIEAQVIVMHEKVLSALYSSLFREMAARFLSLVDSRFLLNLHKDKEGVRDHLQANFPWGANNLRFLENDFSKYDKSQGEFVFGLEAYIMEQLGMDQQLLDRWMKGHAECKIRAFTLGLVFHVDYQRKSGDATTALGNGILNIVSVAYAYRGTDFSCGVFQGDDSLVVAKGVVVTEDAQQVLAEIFNLQAKFYVTNAPYFASNFVVVNSMLERITLVPDPVKLMQRWSQSVDAAEPRWRERWVSAKDACGVYQYRVNTVGLTSMVAERYPVKKGVDLSGSVDAIATAISVEEKFRGLHESVVTVIRG